MLAGACRLQSLLGEALGAFMAVLDRATLADLLPRLGLARIGPAAPAGPPGEAALGATPEAASPPG